MSGGLVRAPIYQQLNQALRELIRSGEFKVGDQFLTERQIRDRYDVSRATANKALSNLVAEGVLEFKKGVGTFVRGGILDNDLRALVSFTEKAQAAGRMPETKVLCLRALMAKDADIDIGTRLGVRPNEIVYYVERLRIADGTPLILERRYISAKFCPALSEADLAGSLYALWTDRYQLDIAGAEQTIRAVPIRGLDARLLGVKSGAAGFLVISTGYIAGNTPLWWERTLSRGDAYEFRNRLGPIQTARPAAGALRELPHAGSALADVGQDVDSGGAG